MKAEAAIASSPDADFAIRPIDLDDPREHEVLVRIIGVGICHTDISTKASGHFTPGVLGHEGSGVIERVGSAVTTLVPGDHVVLSFHACHHCPACEDGHEAYCHNFLANNGSGGRADGSRPVRLDGEPIPSMFFGQSSFATHAIAHENSAVKVPADLPLHLLGPLGCGMMTGAGTVLNALKIASGQSVAIFGSGAVGLAALMAAKSIGAGPIVAVDVVEDRLAMATRLGATHVVKGDEADAVEAIEKIVPGGVDFSIDCTGSPAVLAQAVKSLKPMGVCALVGGGKPGAEATLDMGTLLFGRTVRGVIEGDSDPQRFIPHLIELYRAGNFPFDTLVRTYPFDRINDAFADMASGRTIKPVLTMGDFHEGEDQ